MISFKNFLIYGILLLSLSVSLVFYILGAARYVTDFEDNTCDMTYMFEYPQYVRITLDNDIEEKYPRYGLYAYGEGFVTEKLRRMKFSGIPVLFIPGNAGSHEQVRSLASVSLRKALKHRTPYHFDFFTVSLGNDYSALYGGVLMEETMYIAHCIKKILSLYEGSIDNVVLIGHSMGAMVAKGSLLLTPNINASFASIIINLATPHIPSLVLDNMFANYYQSLEDKVHQIKEAGTIVVSIAGGPRDILVTAGQAVDPLADINVLSTSIPDVWKSTDHLSILWCKQLVLSIVRSLFDSVDYSQKTPKISSNFEHKLQAATYHFLDRAAGKRIFRYKEKVQFHPNGEWIEDIRKQYVWSTKANTTKKMSPVYLMMRLNTPYNYLTIDTTNIESKDWLFICSASIIQDQSRICEWGWNLSNRTRIIPDQFHQIRKSVDLNLEELKYPGMTHIVVRLNPDDIENYVSVSVDLYTREQRITYIKNKISFLGNIFSFSKSNLINITDKSTKYYIILKDTQDTVSIELANVNCANSKQSLYALVELVEPWNPGATQFRFFTNENNGPKTMHVQTRSGHSKIPALLRLNLDQTCFYSFNVHSGSIIDQISCLVRDRWSTFYMIFVSLLLLTISMRIIQGQNMIPIVIVTIALCINFGIVFELSVAMAILCVFAVSICCSIVLFGSLVHGIAVRFLARAIAFSTTCADWLLGGLNQVPLIVTILVLWLIPATCGALAMLISLFIFYLKLTRMYEDYLEELLFATLDHFKWVANIKKRIRFEGTAKNENVRQQIVNQLILFLLWCFAAIPAVPSVLVWAKNFSYETRLSTEDPVLLSSWVVLVICSTLSLVDISSNTHAHRSYILASILQFISWVVLSTAAAEHPSFYHWCMTPTISVSILLIILDANIPGRMA